jgi:hypothetical protein
MLGFAILSPLFLKLKAQTRMLILFKERDTETFSYIGAHKTAFLLVAIFSF